MPPSELTKLSRRERQIVDILYELNRASAQDVLERLPDPPSYSAVRAMLARMVDKELVQFSNEGGKYIYSPLGKEEEAQLSALQRLIKTFFRGSRVKAVNALLETDAEKLSTREIEELERTIARIKEVQAKKDSRGKSVDEQSNK